MPSHLHLAYRRNAQAAAKNHKVRKSKDEHLLEKAKDDLIKIVHALVKSLAPILIYLALEVQQNQLY